MKNKYWIGSGVAALTLIVLVGGFVYWNHSKNSEKVSFGAGTENISSVDPNSAQAGSASSLTPQNSSAQNLGQISQTGSVSNTALGGSTPSQSSSSSSSSSSGIDPSKFAEYDKYKEGNQALFGEVQAGTGATLGNGQTATVVYKGWLTNGQMFDQSKTGSDGKLQPFQFKVGSGQVIAGWDQGLTGMKVGGARLVIVPPAVGYGASGQGPIPGNSVLVFLVQLVDVK
ncbi:MAG: FKBP-type peptidyl-prolyl cis-trans isomerase [Patescibacteria group bacterium]